MTSRPPQPTLENLLGRYKGIRQTVAYAVNYGLPISAMVPFPTSVHAETWNWLRKTENFDRRHPLNPEDAMFDLFMDIDVFNYITTLQGVNLDDLINIIQDIRKYLDQL